MDCSICTTMPSILRPPRNTICGSCYEGARTTIALLKKLEDSKEDQDISTKNGSSLSSSPLFSREPQPLEKVVKWMRKMKEIEEEQKKRIVFLSSFVSGLNEQLHADILVKPGDDSPPISAHRALLPLEDLGKEAADQLLTLQQRTMSIIVNDIKSKQRYSIVEEYKKRTPAPFLKYAEILNELEISDENRITASKSEIFKNILDSDEYKTAPEYDITIKELNSEQLQTLIEFLYTGTMDSDKLEKHVYALIVAADKYMIHYLQELCEKHMLSSLDISSLLDVLDVSDLCSSETLKEACLRFVVENMDDVVFSDKYETFSQKNQHLCVEITRAFLIERRSQEKVIN